MNRILTRVVRECRDCPYLVWRENNSCSNDSGQSVCKWEYPFTPRTIEQNVKYPKIPDWCPLPKTDAE